MRENTPPASPFHGEDEDDELVYVGDNLDDVIEALEEIPDDGPIDDEEGEKKLYYTLMIKTKNEYFRFGHGG